MLIQYYERMDVIAEFDPETGRLHPMPRPSHLPFSATDGWFSILDGTCVVFYRHRRRLWLRAGAELFALDENTALAWGADRGVSWFQVADSHRTIVLRYPSGPPWGPPLSEDPTPFVHDEDWDLGLFITNVMSDEERRRRIRTKTQG